MVIRIETVKWPDLAQLGSCGSSSMDHNAAAKTPASTTGKQQQQHHIHHSGLYCDGSGGTSDTCSTEDVPTRDQQQQQQQQQQSSPGGPGQAHAPDMMYTSGYVFKNVKQALSAAMDNKKETTSSGTTSTRNHQASQNYNSGAVTAADRGVVEVNHTDSTSSSTASPSLPQDSPLHHMWERAGNLVGPHLEEGKQLFQQRWTALFQNGEACVSVVPCNSPGRAFTSHYYNTTTTTTTQQQQSSSSSQRQAQQDPSGHDTQQQQENRKQQPSPVQQQQQQEQQSGGLQSKSSHSSESAGTRGKENTFMSTVVAFQSKAAAVAAAAAVAVALDEEPLVDVNKQQNNNNNQQSNPVLLLSNNNHPRRNNVASPSSEDSVSPVSTAQIEVSSDHQVQVIEPVQRPNTANHDNNNLTNTPPKSPSSSSRKCKRAPLSLLEVKTEDAADLERSISELTMKSSYGGGESLSRIPDNRRMAYYAVGKHHRQSGRGGNRRCYFSGKLILGGAPFYAGAVQQGLRTLVVFCLPSAIGLPDKETIAAHKQHQRHFHLRPTVTPGQSGSNRSLMSAGTNMTGSVLREHSKADSKTAATISSRHSSSGGGGGGLPPASGLEKRPSIASRSKRKISQNDGHSIASKSGMSRLSSLDDLSLSIDGDLDPNWGLDRDFLLKVLPEPDASILHQVAVLYPEQYETLPIQVRDAARWKLFIKFCFFSGLPIAEGEMHYKVRDEIAEIVYGEEIVLSHDVMEAVNGDVSAELLQLPNTKAFRYLRKHYAQQCNKLDDRVFRRAAWERVAPEI